MATKVRDYSLTGTKGLEPDEQLLEINEEKESVNLFLFKSTLDIARAHNYNISRIIRFKFKDWIEEKIQEEGL